MKIMGITVAVALALLATLWILVRADLVDAGLLRFAPALLALVAGVGIVLTVLQKRAEKAAGQKPKRRKR